MSLAAPPLSAACGPILLVDDHPACLLSLQLQLHALGLETCSACDGPAALELLTQRTAALVLMDCSMPAMSGYTAARLIHEQQQRQGRPHLPVIALSSANDDAHLLECLRSGMDGVLDKPPRTGQLLQLLSVWLPTGAIARDASTPRPLPANVDLDTLYANALRADLGTLQQAVARWDLDQALRMSHRLSGAARFAGAEALGDRKSTRLNSSHWE